MRKIALLIVAASTVLTGCVAHLSQQQCQATNWNQVGANDGAAGKQQRSLAREMQDCAKFNIPVDQVGYHKGWLEGVHQYCTPTRQLGETDGQAGRPLENVLSRSGFCRMAGMTLSMRRYKAGYNHGLQSFCTYDTGYDIGVQGHQPPEVCPASIGGKFVEGWKAGARKYCSQSALAFNLGKTGQPYPKACNAAYYIHFQSEYNRGRVVYNRVASLNQQIQEVNDEIALEVSRYGLVRDYEDNYYIGDRRIPGARRALRRIRQLVDKRRGLQDSLFQAKAMG